MRRECKMREAVFKAVTAVEREIHKDDSDRRPPTW